MTFLLIACEYFRTFFGKILECFSYGFFIFLLYSNQRKSTRIEQDFDSVYYFQPSFNLSHHLLSLLANIRFTVGFNFVGHRTCIYRIWNNSFSRFSCAICSIITTLTMVDDDVVLPNSPLSSYLRQNDIIFDPDQKDYAPALCKESHNSNNLTTPCQNTTFLFVNHSLQVFKNLFLSPLNYCRRHFYSQILSFGLDYGIISDDSEFLHVLPNQLSSLEKLFALALLTAFILSCGIFGLVACGLVLFPWLCTAVLLRFYIGPCFSDVTNNLRKCLKLLCEILVVHRGFLYGNSKHSSDLLDRILQKQTNETVRDIERIMTTSMDHIIKEATIFFEKITSIIPEHVKNRRLVVDRNIDLTNSSSLIIKLRQNSSLVSVYLFDISTIFFHSSISTEMSTLGFIRLCFSIFNLYLRIRKVNHALISCRKNAINFDLNNSYQMIEQYSEFCAISKRKGSEDSQLESKIRSFLLHLTELNKRSLEMFSATSNGKESYDFGLLKHRLNLCNTILEEMETKIKTKTLDSNNPFQGSLRGEDESACKDGPRSGFPYFEEEPPQDDLQVFFADTAGKDEEAEKAKQKIDNFWNESAFGSGKNFLNELQSVLRERTEATEQKEREILKERGIDFDSIIQSLEEPLNEEEKLQPPTMANQVDEDTLQARSQLFADFANVRQRLVQQQYDTEEFST